VSFGDKKKKKNDKVNRFLFFFSPFKQKLTQYSERERERRERKEKKRKTRMLFSAQEQQLLAAFKKINQPLGNDGELVSKASMLCSLFKLSPNELADKWEAYLVNHDLSDVTSPSCTHFESLKSELQRMKV